MLCQLGVCACTWRVCATEQLFNDLVISRAFCAHLKLKNGNTMANEMYSVIVVVRLPFSMCVYVCANLHTDWRNLSFIVSFILCEQNPKASLKYFKTELFLVGYVRICVCQSTHWLKKLEFYYCFNHSLKMFCTCSFLMRFELFVKAPYKCSSLLFIINHLVRIPKRASNISKLEWHGGAGSREAQKREYFRNK